MGRSRRRRTIIQTVKITMSDTKKVKTPTAYQKAIVMALSDDFLKQISQSWHTMEADEKQKWRDNKELYHDTRAFETKIQYLPYQK